MLPTESTAARRSARAIVIGITLAVAMLGSSPSVFASPLQPRGLAIDATVAVNPAETRPNIVVVMIDDVAFMDHRLWERLPNIKTLFLDQGIEALNYWGNDPLCCPGRANFLTAQVAHVNGVIRNDARLLDPTETVATELRSVGYYTNICGKYLNKTDKLADKFPPGWDNVAIMRGTYYNYTAYVNDVEEVHGYLPEDYSTDVFADHCIDFLSVAPPEQPIFAFMTPYAVHAGFDIDKVKTPHEPPAAQEDQGDPRCADISPWSPPNYNSADLTGKPGYVRQRPLLSGDESEGFVLKNRCEALLSVDDWVGRTVELLKSQGRYDNTLFVLTADNGMGYGAFRWVLKMAPHTAQMPLFMTWPAVMGAEPRSISNLLTNVDLAPTLCELAGCEMGPYPNGQPADGESFAGLIAPELSASVPQRTSIVLEEHGNTKVPRWRGIMTDPAQQKNGRQWFFIKYPGSTAKELYDLSGSPCYAWVPGMSGDPCMLTNLAKTKKGVLRSLTSQLRDGW